MRFWGLMLVAWAGMAQAHPGPHGEWDLLHFFTEPDHLAALAALLVTGVALLLLRRRSRASARR